MTTREQLEQEAAELYKYAMLQGDCLVPKRSAVDLAKEAHVRKGTVSAEKVTKALSTWDAYRPDHSKSMAENLHDAMTAAFTAAGFYVEGEDDE